MSILNSKYLKFKTHLVLASTLMAILSGCDNLMYQEADNEFTGKGVLESRANFQTSLIKKNNDSFELEKPDVDFVSSIEYQTSIGNMNAYIASVDSGNELRSRPAIIWIMGGLPPGGGDASIWQERSIGNDQSAKSYWKNGFVTMYPSLRGSAGNPGFQEGFYGEVDDILAAYEYLAADKRVDPKRIYLGGHSTGATLALLVAAATDKFSGVIAFGPVSNPVDYGESTQLHDPSNLKEAALRAPINFINQIRIPTIVVEGEEGNQFSLFELSSVSNNSYVSFIVIKDADHFNHLAKSNEMIASAIKNGEDIPSFTKKRFQSAFYNK